MKPIVSNTIIFLGSAFLSLFFIIDSVKSSLFMILGCSKLFLDLIFLGLFIFFVEDFTTNWVHYLIVLCFFVSLLPFTYIFSHPIFLSHIKTNKYHYYDNRLENHFRQICYVGNIRNQSIYTCTGKTLKENDFQNYVISLIDKESPEITNLVEGVF